MLAREGARAAAAFREALRLAVAAQDPWYITFCVIGTAALAATRSDLARATELLAAGITERQRLEMPLRPHVQAALDQILVTLRARLGATAFTGQWDAGRAMPIAAAATAALALLEDIAPLVAQAPAPFGLTRRERDVLRLLAEGYSDKAIADALFISRATASKHVATILAKLDVDSRAGAVAMAIRLGLA